MASVAQTEGAGCRATEIDDNEEECRQGIDAKVGAEPRQAQRQYQRTGHAVMDELPQAGCECGNDDE